MVTRVCPRLTDAAQGSADMKGSRTALAISVVVAMAAVAGGASAGPASDTVMADVHQLIAQFNAHDAAGAVSHDAPDFVGMFHGTPNYIGPAGDLAITKAQLADPAAKVVVTDERVDASGDLAVYRSTYAFTYTDPKTKAVTVEHGNWLLGYRLEPDKTWKVIWSSVSDTGS
jgi:ketosteroid isomerase-like protein